MGIGPSASEEGFTRRKQEFYNIFKDRTLTPKLLEYVRLTNQNVCKSSVMRSASGRADDDFIWFHKNVTFDEDDAEEIRSDGYDLIYASKSSVVENKSTFTGGILLGKSTFKLKLKQCIKSAKQDKIEFFYFDFAISRNGSHITPLIYNAKTKQFEWYDSNGAYSYIIPVSELDPTVQDKESLFYLEDYNVIKGAFTDYLRTVAYELKTFDGIEDVINTDKPFVSVEETCPRFGPQSIEGDYSAKFTDQYEVIGYCQVWSVIYLDTRLKNPDKQPSEINDIVMSTPNYLSYKERGAYLRLRVQKFLNKAFKYLSERNKI